MNKQDPSMVYSIFTNYEGAHKLIFVSTFDGKLKKREEKRFGDI